MNNYTDAFDLKQGLIKKSVEAYVLALETINRLSIQYRLEAFCYLICNAWELLLKAKIIEDDGSEDVIYSNRQSENQRRRSLSLEACLKKVKPNTKDPVRRNIEWIIELRNESTHLVISEIPSELMMLFQAGVVNYHKHLNEWFGESLSDKFPIGMMSIVYDLNRGQVDLTDSRLNQYDLQCVNAVYKIKSRPEYFYQGKVKGSPSQYSQAFVEWLARQHEKKSDFFTKARQLYRNTPKG